MGPQPILPAPLGDDCPTPKGPVDFLARLAPLELPTYTDPAPDPVRLPPDYVPIPPARPEDPRTPYNYSGYHREGFSYGAGGEGGPAGRSHYEPDVRRGRRTGGVQASKPARTKTSIDDLPNETFDQILEHILPDRPALLLAALVCRRWREPAQRVLFGHPLLPFGYAQACRWLDSPARSKFRVKEATILGGVIAHSRRVLSAMEGVTSLRYEGQTVEYDLLLLPELANLKHLAIQHAWNLHPSETSAPALFRLSHLELTLVHDINSLILSKLLLPSSETLTTLTLSNLGPSHANVATLNTLLSSTPFPYLTHLTLTGPSTHPLAVLSLLPSPPLLASLTLSSLGTDAVFRAIADRVDSPPTLVVLRLDHSSQMTSCAGTVTTAPYVDAEEFVLPGLWGLRRLEVPRPFFHWLESGGMGELEEFWEGRGTRIEFVGWR